ncbi:hypothetical protein OC846_000349 [Tilletia horrida]|uniref:Uncharacterized protein n=1 Tax=Tilletia horrida TaxID=155126 RepID=A0AAN6JX21_9BASI|nr:hypothetical protein OC845_000064 [Tilletia horrida]KAK0557561.1 hypothetical protein OC846_000349 [Tilletia horrida]KAK0568305.1 hypothetical protein OC861_002095 [Tilletia horrida]
MMFQLLALPSFALLASAAPLVLRQSGYTDPKAFGGSSIGYFPDNSNGEPLNVIVTGISSGSDFSNWYKAIGYGKECFGLHSGTAMQAFIDSRGLYDQEGEIRYAYGEDPDAEGSCAESLAGYWQQQNTNAWFLAASHEKNIFDHHDIEADGYDIGRDEIVQAATSSSSYNGQTFVASVQYVDGLLPSGSQGINHGIAIDGRTAVLSVTIS